MSSSIAKLTVKIPLWKPSKQKKLLAFLSYPVFYILNRPFFQKLNEFFYDFALRANGIAINFSGKHGLSVGEEKFIFRNINKKETGTIIDVGANAGSYAMLLHHIAPSARIYAFEPHPLTFSRLLATANGANVSVLNQAVGSEVGEFKLYDVGSLDGSTQASLDRSAVELFTSDIVEHNIKCTTIDCFMEQEKIDEIRLLKIDTEGNDLKVLQGARHSIEQKKIKIIQFEFIPANIATKTTMRDFYNALPGYRLYRLCINGEMMPLSTYSVKRCEIYVTHNLIATPI